MWGVDLQRNRLIGNTFITASFPVCLRDDLPSHHLKGGEDLALLVQELGILLGNFDVPSFGFFLGFGGTFRRVDVL